MVVATAWRRPEAVAGHEAGMEEWPAVGGLRSEAAAARAGLQPQQQPAASASTEFSLPSFTYYSTTLLSALVQKV